jgi:DNA-binding CsgD family transcriptional regulator
MNDNNSKSVTTTTQEPPAVLSLTLREHECLSHALQGKSSTQIAAELQLVPSSVYYYLYGVQLKLASFTKAILAA